MSKRAKAEKGLFVRLTRSQYRKFKYYCLSKEMGDTEVVREWIRTMPEPPQDFIIKETGVSAKSEQKTKQ